MNILWTFIIFNAINVVIQTVKSIATIKCGKTAAAVVNAVAYGLYTYVVILTVCDLPLLWKCFIVAGCNFVGVFAVKWFEEKARKDKMWLVKMTIPNHRAETVKKLLNEKNIPYTYYDITKYFVFDTFCSTQADTTTALDICRICEGKAFATENKLGF